MAEASLGKLHTHYFLSQADRAERWKLERLQMKALDEAFELAIERAGIPKDGELCLRSVSAPVHLRLGSSDHSITADWTAELAHVLTAHIRNAPPSRRVFYYSRRHAVLDFALSVARGEYQRAWAWRMLGLWQDRETGASNALRELVQALTREAETIVPAFRYLASLGTLAPFVRMLSANQWRELSEAALMHAGVLPAADVNTPPSSRVFSYALRILKHSQILAAINSSGALARADETIRRAVAVLAIFDAEPALLHSQVAPDIVALVASSIGTAPVNEEPIVASELEQAAPGPFSSPQPAEKHVEQNNDIPDPRQRARTEYGGLLFLINVLDLLEMPDHILAEAVLATRPLSWTLHQLAMTLIPAGPTDAAVLAFAGLPPGASPPSETELPATEIETHAVSLLAARVIDCLSSLFEPDVFSASELLEFVCRREAEIVADPVWLEVRFSLDQVSTEIRRAGLDLNPGYVKWLGVILKFVYE
jgi:hypothetical protein